MSEQLVGRLALTSHRLVPGNAAAFEMTKGDLLQILTMRGKTIADFVTISKKDPSDVLSPSETRAKNNSIMFEVGSTLQSGKGNTLFTIVEDTVGRHDTLLPACRGKESSQNGTGGCQQATVEALKELDSSLTVQVDPIHWFMNVAILQRGELELRESLADPNDHLLLRAESDVVVAVSACDQVYGEFEANEMGDILVRVFR